MNQDKFVVDDPKGIKLDVGYVFLTFTLDDVHQFLPTSEPVRVKRTRSRNRVITCLKLFDDTVVPVLKNCMETFEWSIEVSEALASNGKHFPRIHFHVIGLLKDPVFFLLEIGYLMYTYSWGYHVIAGLTEEQFNVKLEYLCKQRKLWALYGKSIKLCHKTHGVYPVINKGEKR